MANRRLNDMAVRSLLRSYMRDHDLSQRDFARMIGVHESTICKLLGDKSRRAGETLRHKAFRAGVLPEEAL